MADGVPSSGAHDEGANLIQQGKTAFDPVWVPSGLRAGMTALSPLRRRPFWTGVKWTKPLVIKAQSHSGGPNRFSIL
jgi:hypothetical protein